MAYMDVKGAKPNGETVLLFHGKNFNGYYWKETIRFLTDAGYRVVVPDQVGWGRSDKPNIHYSFHLLAANTKALLDTLGINEVHLIGHSMGGMLATRFALLYPQAIGKIIYENPIGLEDYKTFVPYQSIEKLVAKEKNATLESYQKYQQTYYPIWKPEYEQYAVAQADAWNYGGKEAAAWANALTYQMIYEQPVVYEFKNVSAPALIIMGQEDRTVVGKDQLTKEAASKHGHYPTLGKWLQGQIKNSKLVALRGVSHIPHIQVPQVFETEVLNFLKK
jgi:pimeloyl-ACP methyl ester carboxylesterase